MTRVVTSGGNHWIVIDSLTPLLLHHSLSAVSRFLSDLATSQSHIAMHDNNLNLT